MKTLYSVNEMGLDGCMVEVQTHLSNGLPTMQIIGVVGKSLDEAKERIRSAFSSTKLELPRKKITINIAPSDIPKDGSHFDVPIALSILAEADRIRLPKQSVAFFGELGLDGQIKPVRGVLGKILFAKKAGYNHFVIPEENSRQAKLVPGIHIASVPNLARLYKDLGSEGLIFKSTDEGAPVGNSEKDHSVDFSDVIGQDLAKRALEIAAAGNHNVLLSGPPGVGKSMLAKALISIMPPLTRDEIITVTHLHSLIGVNSSRLVTRRPVRAPHHSSSDVAIIGGGQKPKPGEVTLSHTGVLFLDELPEFKRSTIESLRQPLEDKEVTVSRAQKSAQYPADFLLIATKNPCPCGYYGSSKPCICAPLEIDRYQKKLSGPLLDRIDLHITVDSVDHTALLAKKMSTNTQSSNVIRSRVMGAINNQKQRFTSPKGRNGSMNNKQVKQHALLTDEAKGFLDVAAKKLDLSARVYMKVVKVARTIADLDNSDTVQLQHITEALQYRPAVTT